jgi:hypothetical protein
MNRSVFIQPVGDVQRDIVTLPEPEQGSRQRAVYAGRQARLSAYAHRESRYIQVEFGAGERGNSEISAAR